MATFGEFIKGRKESDLKFFYGESVKKVTNQYINFERIIDDDTIIIITNNIKFIKENAVLVVDKNKAVYLKAWQLRKIHNYNLEINSYAVKLNKKFFKPYTFKFNFDDFSFENEDTFESLSEIAKTQTYPIAEGWMFDD